MIPTRFVNRNTELNVLTVDQLIAVHGPHPVQKRWPIPADRIGPRSRAEIAGLVAAERIYGHPKDPGQGYTRPASTTPSPQALAPPRPTFGDVRTDRLYDVPTPRPRPQARLKPLAVSPTDPSYTGPETAQPCGAIIELEIEVPDVGIVLYPVECEILGEHPNQPHCTEVPGALPEPTTPFDRQLDANGRPRPAPAQRVFVGWGDRE